ncbi:MAG: hypothetical protein LC135_06185 [Phycisphaerae bacterium]|nr:hypothetical protein [Phycisphaerae bacterium]MCZ2399446.1 hypothetical protein [Phycisphaerae bacterium]
MLAAIGAGSGLAACAGEAAWHLPPQRAQALLLAACGAGAALGFWLPRRVILARLSRHAAAAPGRAVVTADAAFASAAAAGLCFLLGLAWLLVLSVALSLEDWRELVMRQWLLPRVLQPGLLLAPLAAATLLMSAAATVLLVVLHGWHRLANPTGGAVMDLWALVLGAMAVGGAVAAVLPQDHRLPVLAAPLCTFLAAVAPVVTGARPRGAVPGAVVDPTARPPRTDVLTVASAAAVVASAAIALGAAADANMGGRLAWLAAGAASGVLLARLLLWMSVPDTMGALALLVAAAASLSRQPDSWAGIVGAVAGSVAIVVAARRVARAGCSRQSTLASCGAAAALAAFAVAAVASMVPAIGSAVLVRAVALAAAAAAVSQVWRADLADRPFAMRGLSALLGAAVILLGAVTWPAAPQAEALPTPQALQDSPATRLAHELYAAGAMRIVHVTAPTAVHEHAVDSAWSADRQGASADVVVVAAGAPEAVPPPAADRQARRLSRRLWRAAAPGGRLVIELPAGALARAAAQADMLRSARPGTRAFALRVTHNGSEYEALLAGPDVAEWIGQRPLPPAAVVKLTPLGPAPGADGAP